MIQIKDLSKMYKGSDKYSVSHVNMKIATGEVVGLVGRNGAGKSTIIKCLTGILPFKEGEIIVDNIDVKKKPKEAKKIIGYVPDDHSIYDKLTGREYINYMGSLFGVSKQDKQERLDLYAKKFDIAYALDNQISSYSHGMKQKVCLIGSLIHQPKIWVLDEPMLGLDPQTMDELKETIREYAKQGNTVLFSSHNLDVVDEICDLIGIMKNGELASCFRVKDVKDNPFFSLKNFFNYINSDEGKKEETSLEKTENIDSDTKEDSKELVPTNND